MGFSIRKSVRVGPLRFNLSKSGIGVSSGIPGFRVGMGPRGNYVHLGAGGLYYRSTFASPKSPPAPPAVRPAVNQLPSHGPLEEINSSDAAQMTDSSSAALLAELDQKARRINFWPLAAVFALALVTYLSTINTAPWITTFVGLLALIGVIYVYQLDLLSKSVVILYEIDPVFERASDWLHACITQLDNCDGKWRIDARGHVYDPKYHGGAGQLVKRTNITFGTGQPPRVTTNITTPFISLGATTLYFFPERILVFARNGVGAVSYDDLSIVVHDKQFIEEDSVPRDAKVINHTWRYVNKNGTPDRRFNNNRQIPICLYEELWFNSPTGLNEVLQVSQTGIGRQLDNAIQRIADIVKQSAPIPLPQSSPPAVTASTHHEAETSGVKKASSASQDASERLFHALLEILCCVMVADGHASKSEKERILELMTKVRSPWTNSEVNERMQAFIDRVRRDGYRRTLAGALKEVEIFKQINKQDILLRCLNAVAEADENLTDREIQLCQRIKMIVE